MKQCVEIASRPGRRFTPGTKKGSVLFGIAPDERQGESCSLFRAPGQQALRVVRFMGNPGPHAQVIQTGIRLGSILRMRRVGGSCMVRVTGKQALLCLSRSLCEKIIVQPARIPRVLSLKV
ncbi:MAG: hypothetical protein ABFD97_00960 [Syntrophobacter sp.]